MKQPLHAHIANYIRCFIRDENTGSPEKDIAENIEDSFNDPLDIPFEYSEPRELLIYIQKFWRLGETRDASGQMRGAPDFSFLKEKLHNEGEFDLMGYLNTLRDFHLRVGTSYLNIKNECKEAIRDNTKKKTLQNFHNAIEDEIEVKEGFKKKKIKGRKEASEHFIPILLESGDQPPYKCTEPKISVQKHFERIRDYQMDPNKFKGAQCDWKDLREKMDGIVPGDLFLVGAYSEECKTTFCMNYAHMSALLGKNVVYVSLEEPEEKMISKLLDIHANNMYFRMCYDHDLLIPTTTNDYKKGVATDYQKYLYQEAGQDWANEYSPFDFVDRRGRFDIIQNLEKVSPKKLIQWVMRENLKDKTRPYDLLVLDYPALMKPDDSHASKGETENLTEILQSLKLISTTFNGTGIGILSPWQISREGKNLMDKRLEKKPDDYGYEKYHFAGAAEAERSATKMISLCMPKDLRARGEIYVKCHKGRDSGHFEPFFLNVNLATSTIRGKEWDQTDGSTGEITEISL